MRKGAAGQPVGRDEVGALEGAAFPEMLVQYSEESSGCRQSLSGQMLCKCVEIVAGFQDFESRATKGNTARGREFDLSPAVPSRLAVQRTEGRLGGLRALEPDNHSSSGDTGDPVVSVTVNVTDVHGDLERCHM